MSHDLGVTLTGVWGSVAACRANRRHDSSLGPPIDFGSSLPEGQKRHPVPSRVPPMAAVHLDSGGRLPWLSGRRPIGGDLCAALVAVVAGCMRGAYDVTADAQHDSNKLGERLDRSSIIAISRWIDRLLMPALRAPLVCRGARQRTACAPWLSQRPRTTSLTR